MALELAQLCASVSSSVKWGDQWTHITQLLGELSVGSQKVLGTIACSDCQTHTALVFKVMLAALSCGVTQPLPLGGSRLILQPESKHLVARSISDHS